MATSSYEAFYNALKGKIGVISAGGPITITIADSDVGTDFKITAGAAEYQIQIEPLEDYYRSNDRYPRVAVTIFFHHRASSKANEDNFLQKTVYYIADAFMNRAAWQAFNGVYELEPDTEPQMSISGKEGKVTTVELSAIVLLDQAS